MSECLCPCPLLPAPDPPCPPRPPRYPAYPARLNLASLPEIRKRYRVYYIIAYNTLPYLLHKFTYASAATEISTERCKKFLHARLKVSTPVPRQQRRHKPASFGKHASLETRGGGGGGAGAAGGSGSLRHEYLKTSASQNMFENSTSQNSRHSAALPPSLAPGDAEQHRHRLSAVGLSSTCLSSTSHFVSSSPTPCFSLTRQPSESRSSSSKPKSVTQGGS